MNEQKAAVNSKHMNNAVNKCVDTTFNIADKAFSPLLFDWISFFFLNSFYFL